MEGRTKNRWEVTLQRADGDLVQFEVENYWAVEYEDIQEAIGRTAAAEAWYQSGKRHEFAPVAVVLKEAV